MSTALLWRHSGKPGSRSRGRGKSCPISVVGYQAHCWEGMGNGIDIPSLKTIIYNLHHQRVVAPVTMTAAAELYAILHPPETPISVNGR